MVALFTILVGVAIVIAVTAVVNPMSPAYADAFYQRNENHLWLMYGVGIGLIFGGLLNA